MLKALASPIARGLTIALLASLIVAGGLGAGWLYAARKAGALAEQLSTATARAETLAKARKADAASLTRLRAELGRLRASEAASKAKLEQALTGPAREWADTLLPPEVRDALK